MKLKLIILITVFASIGFAQTLRQDQVRNLSDSLNLKAYKSDTVTYNASKNYIDTAKTNLRTEINSRLKYTDSTYLHINKFNALNDSITNLRSSITNVTPDSSLYITKTNLDSVKANRAYTTHGHSNYLLNSDTSFLFYVKHYQQDTAISNRAYSSHTHATYLKYTDTTYLHINKFNTVNDSMTALRTAINSGSADSSKFATRWYVDTMRTNVYNRFSTHTHGIGGLADVDTAGINIDDVLGWNGTKWVKKVLSAGGSVGNADSLGSVPALSYLKKEDSSYYVTSYKLDTAIIKSPSTVTSGSLPYFNSTTGKALGASPTTIDANGLIQTTLSSVVRTSLNPNVSDGASAVAYRLGTKNALSTSGANLFELYNQDARKYYVDKDGGMTTSGSATILGSYLSVSGSLNVVGSIKVANKAVSAWLSFATRNTSGSEAVYDLSNVGSITANSISLSSNDTTLSITDTSRVPSIKAAKTYADNKAKVNADSIASHNTRINAAIQLAADSIAAHNTRINALKQTVNDTIANHRHTFRVPHTWAIAGGIKTDTTTNYLIPMIVDSVAGQVTKFVSFRALIHSGTNAAIKFQKSTAAKNYTGWTDITDANGTVLTTGLSVDFTDVQLSAGDAIRPVVTSVSSTPKDMTISIYLEYTR